MNKLRKWYTDLLDHLNDKTLSDSDSEQDENFYAKKRSARLWSLVLFGVLLALMKVVNTIYAHKL